MRIAFGAFLWWIFIIAQWVPANIWNREHYIPFQEYIWPLSRQKKDYPKRIVLNYRAENETRTRDPNLGKVVLYQLSYFRVSLPSQVILPCLEGLAVALSLKRSAKVSAFSQSTKWWSFFFRFFYQNGPFSLCHDRCTLQNLTWKRDTLAE